jgi:hypothetical protein
MAKTQKFRIVFCYVEIIDGQKRLRSKERDVEAANYDDAEWKVRREFLARNIEIKVFRIPQKN